MTISEVASILSAEIIVGDDLAREVKTACGSDMMSDALAFVKEKSVLLTGLVNPQSLRTADMMDMPCVVLVRGKKPDESMIALARERGIVLMSTSLRMFVACGKLYSAGLQGDGEAEV